MTLKRLRRAAAALGLRPKYAYRVGDMLVREGTRSWFKLERRRLRKKGKDIGFDSPDVHLSVVKDKTNRYHAAMHTIPKSKELKLHALAHALHLKLYQENGLRVERHSPIFWFEHEIMRSLERRRMFESEKKYADKIPMRMLQKGTHLEEDAPTAFREALMHAFPTRACLMEAISHFYANPAIKQRILRLNATQEDISPADIKAFADFFVKEAMQK